MPIKKKEYNKVTRDIKEKVRKITGRKNVSTGEVATKRIKKIAIELSDTKGLKPIGQIMTENGYSESYSKTPQKLTRSKSWKESIDELFPEDRVARILKEAGEANIVEIDKQTGIANQTEMPDHKIRLKSAELGMKARGRINKKQEDSESSNSFSLVDLSKASIELTKHIKEEVKEGIDKETKNKGVIDINMDLKTLEL